MSEDFDRMLREMDSDERMHTHDLAQARAIHDRTVALQDRSLAIHDKTVANQESCNTLLKSMATVVVLTNAKFENISTQINTQLDELKTRRTRLDKVVETNELRLKESGLEIQRLKVENESLKVQRDNVYMIINTTCHQMGILEATVKGKSDEIQALQMRLDVCKEYIRKIGFEFPNIDVDIRASMTEERSRALP